MNRDMQRVLMAAIDSADSACRRKYGCRDAYDCRECELSLEGCITHFVAGRLLEQFDIAKKREPRGGGVMKRSCETCKHDKGRCLDRPRSGSHKLCYQPATATNADRFRAMSDEELATGLLAMFEEICEDGIPSKEWMMMWLQQPAEGVE